MSDVYLETLKHYLSGPEWHQSIDIFVASNCKYFSNISELDHQQYELWKTFQEIVEAILEMALESTGGSIQQLEDAIDLVQKQPSRGPREDLVKDLLEQLLSFTDFHSFAGMMKQAYDSRSYQDTLEGKLPVPGEHIDAMLRMGFPVATIDAVIAEASPGASLEELIIAVSGHHSSFGAYGANASAQAGNRSGSYGGVVDDASHQSHDPSSGAGAAIDPALSKFVKEAAEDGLNIDLNELNAKFVIADSVLESFDRAARVELGGGAAMEDLLRWAEDMRLLLNDLHTAYEEQLPVSSMCFNCSEGLVQWYRQLEEARQAVDQASVAGSMLSDAELHRMAELDRIAALGTADEQLLHGLISRHDAVSKEVQALHRSCGLLVASDRRGIRRDALEELYMCLKEQVASGVDLGAASDELWERVEELVPSNRAAEVVSLLLELHVMEDEQSILQRRIHSLLAVEGGTSGHSQQGDAFGLGDVELNSSLGAKGEDGAKTEWARGAPRSRPEEKSGEADMWGADAKHTATEAARFNPTSNPNSNAAERDAVRRRQEETALAGLKEEHRASVQRLRDVLEEEKARQLRALEDKLLRRRSLLQQTLEQKEKLQQCGTGRREEAETAALLAEQRRSVAEAEAEIADAQVRAEHTADGLISGLKKRCVMELAAAKKKLSALEAAEGDSKAATEDCRLTEQERAAAHREAAEALKQRFERDQRALLDSLEEEREKQRERVLRSLATRRKKDGGVERAITAAEVRDETQALVAMDVEFDGMQAAALAKALEHALLALASIHLSDADLALNTSAHAGDGEEDYLEGGTSTAQGRQWVGRVERVKDAYLAASSDLVHRLRACAAAGEAVAGGGGGGGGGGVGGFGEAAALAARLLSGAFDQHIEECARAVPLDRQSSQKAGPVREDAARVRAGILEEFERTRRQLEEGLDHAQAARKAKLAQRRAARGGGANAEDADSKEAGESVSEGSVAASAGTRTFLLERAVDGFLDGEALPDLPTVYRAALEQARDRPSEEGRIKNRARQEAGDGDWEVAGHQRERERIKQAHASKEHSLMQELESSMAEQRRALQDRLKNRKRTSPSRTIGGSSEGGGDHALNSDGDGSSADRDALEQLEQAFQRVRAHLRTLPAEELPHLSAGALAEFLERSAKGERPSLPGGPSVAVVAPAAGTAPQRERLVVAQGPTVARRPSSDDQAAMAGEVRRISMEYSEEKQKLDLMMKIQQARQRQALQRKLFEKSQRRQQQQEHDGGPGEDELHAQSKEQYNGIEIGAHRGLAPLKLRQGASLQPAFKGLPAEAYQGHVPSGGGASDANRLQSQQSFALRGLNLGPMMRK